MRVIMTLPVEVHPDNDNPFKRTFGHFTKRFIPQSLRLYSFTLFVSSCLMEGIDVIFTVQFKEKISAELRVTLVKG